MASLLVHTRGVARWRTVALAQLDHPIGRLARKAFLGAVRPAHVVTCHALHRSQAEVGARVVAALVAIARVDAAQPEAAAGPDRDLGPVGVAPQRGIDRPDEQPMALLGSDVAIEA